MNGGVPIHPWYLWLMAGAGHNDGQGLRIEHPQPFDVLLGRGRGHVNNPGNQRLRFAVEMHADRYNDPSTPRAEKTAITLTIVHFIKHCGTQRGRFLRRDEIQDCWFEISDEAARLKVGNALRHTRRV